MNCGLTICNHLFSTTEKNMTTRLERLNELLQDPSLNLPTFRQTVTPAFGNLQWLKAKLPKNPKCTDELRTLLELDAKSLLEPA